MIKTAKGFTIVEIIVVIVAIGILSTIGAYSYNKVLVSTHDSEKSSKITIISEELEKYYDKNGEYPSCSAMSQSAGTIASDILSGINQDALATPNSASGTNSILPACANLTGSVDAFAYVGNTSAACRTGTVQAGSCSRFNLKYIEESSGNIISIPSRHYDHSIITYTLAISASPGGTVNSNAANGDYDSGDTPTIIATPNTNYSFSGWTGGGNCALPTNTASHTISMTSNQTCIANFTSTELEWITIGSQTWAKTNLNVGDKVSGTLNQADNSIIEKYCYGNDDNNCATYGGLYQWDEAMQYSTSPDTNNQGICPTGSHIPTDNDWKILQVQLGMTQVEADKTSGYIGTDQGTQLKPGGSSGLNMPLGGYLMSTLKSFLDISGSGNYWSSSEIGTSAWRRSLYSIRTTVGMGTNPKAYGLSIRCLKN